MWQSTLADSFLADFDDDDAEQQPAVLTSAVSPATAPRAAAATAAARFDIDAATGRHTSTSTAEADDDEEDEAAGSAGVDSEQFDDDAAGEALDGLPATSQRASSSLSPLLTSGALPSHLSALSALLGSSAISPEREYPYLSASIRLLASIDSEVALVHRYLLSVYSARYSELEQLVASPVHYARVVRLLANFASSEAVSACESELQAFLPNNVVLTISVTAATSTGRLLTTAELDSALEAASTILSLDDSRLRIVSYMESRMSAIAPNLSALVGPTVAAHLLSAAGGLRKLSEIPACNVQVLGSRKQRSSHLSSVAQELHVGAISGSAVMLACPAQLRRKAARLLAAKVTLAARVDEQRSDASGEVGRELLAHVEAKLELWQQAPPQALTKALPAPLAQSNKKRRGGKRFRREKERYAISATHKAKNRMAFGKEELVDEYTGEEFGMLGQREGSGQLRNRATDTQQLSSRPSKGTRKRLRHGAGNGRGGVGGATSTVGAGGGGGVGGGGVGLGGAVTVIGGGGGGTASSIAFTPVQGMELVNNEQKRFKQADSTRNYFAANAAFSKAHIKAAGSSSPGNGSSSGHITDRNVSASAASVKPLPPVPKF